MEVAQSCVRWLARRCQKRETKNRGGTREAQRPLGTYQKRRINDDNRLQDQTRHQPAQAFNSESRGSRQSLRRINAARGN